MLPVRLAGRGDLHRPTSDSQVMTGSGRSTGCPGASNFNRIGADVTLRIVPADEAVVAQNEARDAFLATVKAATRLGRIATIAIAGQ
jgi:hypothetical protein